MKWVIQAQYGTLYYVQLFTRLQHQTQCSLVHAWLLRIKNGRCQAVLKLHGVSAFEVVLLIHVRTYMLQQCMQRHTSFIARSGIPYMSN